MPLAGPDRGPVRDDGGVDEWRCLAQRRLQLRQFGLIDDGIEGEVEANAPRAAALGGLWQGRAGEVTGGQPPHVERVEAEVNRICARVQRGLQAGHVTGWRENFREAFHNCEGV